MTITINTRLHSGIYKSQGGGEIRTHYTWATGPRNLLKAITTLSTHRANTRASCGGIGCGTSWLEIDGVVMSENLLNDVSKHDADGMSAYDRALTHRTLQSPTEKARAVLANVAAYSQAAEAAILADAE
jgi:hypothetical protein